MPGTFGVIAVIQCRVISFVECFEMPRTFVVTFAQASTANHPISALKKGHNDYGQGAPDRATDVGLLGKAYAT